MNVRCIAIVLICSFSWIRVFSQQGSVSSSIGLPKLSPVSPNAAVLGKFGEIPVGFYTGVPSISIPLYTIKTGAIELPISIDYHGGGIKVEEMASMVGLGWGLNFGGVISRSPRGLEDEMGFRLQGIAAKRFYDHEMTEQEEGAYLTQVYRGLMDSEADIFFFNIGNKSGRFFFTNEGKLIVAPRSDLRVELLTTPSFSWKITDGMGIQYFFSASEITQSEPYCASSDNPNYNSGTMSTSTSSWFLTKIVDANNNQVEFIYGANGGSSFMTKTTVSRNLSLNGVSGQVDCPPDFSWCSNRINIFAGGISEIRFGGGKILFKDSSQPRVDDHRLLDKIFVVNNLQDTIKQYQLHTSYFTVSNVGGCDGDTNARLRLDSLSFSGGDREKRPSYKFKYNPIPLPCRLSNAQDYWGYYNGKNNNTLVQYRNQLGGPLLGADKTPDAYFAKAGILEEITYPTGGLTKFEYEGNSYGQYHPAGFDLRSPGHLKSIQGNNANHQGSSIVTFQYPLSIESVKLNPQGKTLLKVQLTTYCADPSVLHSETVRIFNSSGFSRTLLDGDTLSLLNGNYMLQGIIETEFAGAPYAELSLRLDTIPYKGARWENEPTGGVRLKRKRNISQPGHAGEVFRYLYGDVVENDAIPDSISSGVFTGIPEYTIQKTIRIASPPCDYVSYNSVSNYPLSLAGGKPIGYKYVTELFGENGENGKKVMTYTTHWEYPDLVDNSFPFPSGTDYSWKRGLLKNEKIYKRSGATFQLQQEKVIVYTFFVSDTTKRSSCSIKVGDLYETPNLNGSEVWDLFGLQSKGYLNVSEAFNISSDTLFVYTNDAPVSRHKTVNVYDFSKKNFQIQVHSVYGSGGDIVRTFTSYPPDYSLSVPATSSTSALANLVRLHMISVPIENYQTKTISGDEFFLSGYLNFYKSSQPLLDTVMSFRLASSPQSASSVVKSHIDSNGRFVYASQYEPRINFPKYDQHGNILEQKRTQDAIQSFIWGYNNTELTVEAINADVASISYASFEPLEVSSWNISSGLRRKGDAVTGDYSYLLTNGVISRSLDVTTSAFKLTGWFRDGNIVINGLTPNVVLSRNGWSYFEMQIPTGTTNVSISGTAFLDELRLFPVSALVTSYTHIPGVGITSKCDPNGLISYFEYDSLGRLVLVRDENRKIVKRFTYNFAH